MRLKELRLQKGLTQKQLGEMIDFRQTSIADWEKGITQPSIQTLCKIADILECSVDYLIEHSDDFGNTQSRGEELAPNERELLEMYRVLSVEGKGQAQSLVKSVKEYETAQRKKSGVKLG